jgi:uncharacterized membrane protein
MTSSGATDAPTDAPTDATLIDEHVHVLAPPDRVFALLTDLRRLPEWAESVVSTDPISAEPMATGHRFRQHVRILGRPLDIDVDVTEVSREGPVRAVAYEAAGPGGAWARMRQRVVPEDEGCRVEVELAYVLPGGAVGRLAGRAFGERVNERVARRSLAALKRLVESSP